MILIVDNEPEITFLVSEYFKKEGLDIVSTQSPEEALQMIREGNFKVVITDIVMPKLSGVELSKLIRKEKPEIKIICISGFEEKKIKDLDLIKADSFIEKPFMPKELKDKIFSLIPDNSQSLHIP